MTMKSLLGQRVRVLGLKGSPPFSEGMELEGRVKGPAPLEGSQRDFGIIVEL